MPDSFGSTAFSWEQLTALLNEAWLKAWQKGEGSDLSWVRTILLHPMAPRSWPQTALRDALRLDWVEMIEMLLSLPRSRRPRPSRMKHSFLRRSVVSGCQKSVAELVHYKGPGRICVLGRDGKPTRLASRLYWDSEGGLVSIVLVERGHPALWSGWVPRPSDFED